MTHNIGGPERIVRIVAGLAILSLLYFLEGNMRYWGLLGLVPLLTGVSGWCPPYALFGISTSKRSKAENA
ncbi:MAG: DUF2892 domain-containing protein [Rhodospirillales bacterium]|nr:DUF2892 domain-containing protein [Rhodospirillales bacterium]